MSLRKRTLTLLTGITTAACAQTIGAQVLMLNFGGNAPTGGSLLNSPYHAESGDTDSSFWNDQGKGSDSTLNWADGTGADGIGYTAFKNSSGGSTSMAAGGWSSHSSQINGSSINTGIYSPPSAATGGWMMTETFTSNRAIGIQLYGLENGIYDVYITGRNTNVDTAYTLNYHYATTDTAGAFDIASYASESISFASGATDKTSAWTFDAEDPSASNYVKFSISITEENPFLNLAASGDGVNGIFSSIQIVAVPEPSDFALAGGILSLLFVFIRRNRKS